MPPAPFQFAYRVCLADTDAAGVVYFSRLLEICHRAYEAALADRGINIAAYLAPEATLALPISQVEARFFHPLRCGNILNVHVAPVTLDPCRFAVDYQVFLHSHKRPAAIARTVHICIEPHQRQRQPLPNTLLTWVGACD